MLRFMTGALCALSLLIASSPSFAQSGCSGQASATSLCGNPTGSQALPGLYNTSTFLDTNFSASQGQILNRGSSVWASTATPALGKNGGTGGSLTLEGSTSGAATISVPAAAGTVTFQLPNTNGSVNNILQTDGAGHLSWTAAGGGTVSSVGLSMPSIFTVTNSPVTSTGTLTATLASESANLCFCGPTSGSAAAPTFRSLVGADLPNPSATTLGGIQSTTGTTHQWISSISTSGVPGLSQPAFTDISGTVAASQLPDPTTSSLGGIQAINAVTSNWIHSISTLGVPQLSQPAFSDISGNAVLSQLPSIGNNTVLSNVSGSSATPLANSISSILDTIGSAQGDVLYRNASGWVVLSPGTNGQVLTTSGAAANPAWQTISGTGTVTSIATNNGVTGGTITTTGTIGLATIATGNVLAYTGAGSGVPTATAPSAVLDVIGSTEGEILYRGATNWSVLVPGTSGEFLQTGGSGSTPSWASAVTSAAVAGAGLTVNSGTCTITTTGTCTLTTTAAVKSDQTTGSSTSVAVVPAVQQFHPSAAKAWFYFGSCTVNGNCSLAASYGITSIVRSNTGTYTINFSTAFTSANYACSIMPGQPTQAMTASIFGTAPTATALEFVVVQTSNVTLTDASWVQGVCFGTQ